MIPRRTFLKQSLGLAATTALATGSLAGCRAIPRALTSPFEISLAQWSLHRRLQGRAGEPLDPLDFAAVARSFEIDAIEYVNGFFADKARDFSYLRELRQRADDHGVRSLLIMIDNAGRLGAPEDSERHAAVESHKPWVEAARFLGCHSIRVNAYSEGSFAQQQELAIDGLRQLCVFADPFDVDILVENHGGFSSHGRWLAEVIQGVSHRRAGTLPDFGNFSLDDGEWYDRYQGVQELMPYARAVSAKSYDFDEQGNEKHTDFARMMQIVVDAGYHGYVGIEYEGGQLDEMSGIQATLRLLRDLQDKLQRPLRQRGRNPK